MDRSVRETARTKWDEGRLAVGEGDRYSRFTVQTNCGQLYSPYTHFVHPFDGCCINLHAIKWWTTSFVVSHLWLSM